MVKNARKKEKHGKKDDKIGTHQGQEIRGGRRKLMAMGIRMMVVGRINTVEKIKREK
jgi:hypothetical protein